MNIYFSFVNLRSTTSATAKVVLWTKILKICCALIKLRFIFFVLTAQFYILKLVWFRFDCDIDKCQPS